MEEEGEGLGGSGPGRVWPVSAMPGLREEVSEVAKQYGSSATLLLLVFNK